ncbi:MAG: hypothetical protein ACTSRA_10270, partial [Promethearchaeota archaeon]
MSNKVQVHNDLKSSVRRIWLLSKKNIRLYVKQGPVLIFGILFPFFMALAWVIGRPIPLTHIFVGIVSMSAFFTATAISPVVLPIETRERSLEKLLSMPVTLREILASIVVASVIYSSITTYTVFVIFISLLKNVTIQIPMLLLGILMVFLLIIAGSLLG